MKPVIGIPLRYRKVEDGRAIIYMPERLRRTIQIAGGYVFPIAPVQDIDYIDAKNDNFPSLTVEEEKMIHDTIKNLDGILFPGGTKFTPYDRYLLECAIQMNIPILGICLGMQMMGCYKGDVIIEENETNHFQEDDNELTHEVVISKDSRLYRILQEDKIKVNSFHKRHIVDSNQYTVVAVSTDGIIEAIEYPSKNFNLGIQWHPEISYEFDDNSKKIIDSFVDEAIKHKTKQIKINAK